MSSSNVRLSFGLAVHPDGDVIDRFDELAQWMRANADLDLRHRSSNTYEELAASVREGTSDIAWLPPVAYARLAEGVTPVGSIVRAGAKTYCAALVVREDSKLEKLQDLEKVRAGWVDRWSAAGYVVPRLELARKGVKPYVAFSEETFHGTHRRALRALAAEECDVVGTYARSETQGAWSQMDDLVVRVLAIFSSIPPDVIAVRRNLAPADYDRVASAFRAACADDRARTLVRAVFDGDELHETLESGHETLRISYESGVANGLFD